MPYKQPYNSRRSDRHCGSTNGRMIAMKRNTAASKWELMANRVLEGECLTLEEGLSVLDADNDELLPLMQAAFQVRKHFFGKKVKLNMIINAKSGLCPEDCGYCSQSAVSTP